MRERHMEHVERWANYVKSNPDWKKLHTAFINAQYAKHDAFLRRLLKTPGGKEKVIKLYNIKNLKGYAGLLEQRHSTHM